MVMFNIDQAFTIKVISSLLFITSKFSKSLAQLRDSLYYYILVFQFKSGLLEVFERTKPMKV